MAYQFIITALLLTFAVDSSAIQRYQASIEESRWELSTSPLQCELIHPVPRYGRGRFVYSAGGELAFEMHVEVEPPVKDSVASMMSMPPFWKPGQQKELAQLSLSKGKMPFYASRDLALRMLYELDAGSFPTLHYKDWADQTEDVYVALSSANFHDVLPQFQQCVNSLIPYGVADLKDAKVLFEFNMATLDEDATSKLDEMALFARHEKDLSFFIEGHTDSKGTRRYNQRLSHARVNEVKKYLLSQGVKSKNIKIKAYGERHPIAKNTTEEGRAANRRVTVSVVRGVN